MISFLTLSLTSFMLVGFLVVLTFTNIRLKTRTRLLPGLLGVIFSVAVIFIGLHEPLAVTMIEMHATSAGPLVFAGYLGGLPGAVIAGGLGAAHGFWIGEPAPLVMAVLALALSATGLLVKVFRPLPSWPDTRAAAIGYLVGGAALVVGLASVADGGISQTGGALGSAMVGALSVVAMWQILNMAFRHVDHANRTEKLTNRLDLVMRASGMGMFVLKIGDPGPHYDAGMIAMFGLDRKPGVVPMTDLMQILHPEDFERIRVDMNKAWAGGQFQGKFDYRAILPDGTVKYIHMTWIAEANPQGRVFRVTGINADLTDIHNAEQLAHSSRERVASIAEKLPGAIVDYDVTDWDNPILQYISPKCVDIWGYTDTELLANPSLLIKMHDPSDLGRFLKAVKASCASGETLYHRYKITARDGQCKWLDFHGGPAVENDRILVKAIVLDATLEVDLQLRMEKEREISRRAQKNESIGQLTGGVAHDFNNLLAVILGNLELLREDEPTAIQHDMIDAAIAATLRGADLTRNMLAFARQAPLMPVVLDLNAVVRDSGNWMARAVPESVVVETSLLAGLWPIEADRSSLESALLNLILNARDAVNGHGKLTIETANVRIDDSYIDMRQEDVVPGRYVMLAVSDDGAGIAPGIIGSIFEPFFTTKPTGVGSGLGLSMTFGFMRQSGGTVQVYSEVGQGTTFKLYFPAVTKDVTRLPSSVRHDRLTTKAAKRILLAEDEEAVRVTLVSILERAGYDVTAADSGDAALAVFEADPTFDLLLTDIVMPGTLQGTGLAKTLRARRPNLPVLFMSGYASEATVHGNGLRPDDIRMTKPVQRSDLLDAIVKTISTSKE